MAKWQLGMVVVFSAIFALTVLLTGEAIFLVPVGILALLMLGYALAEWAMTRRVTARHDSLEDAMSDESEPLPTSHLIPDDRTAAGDTPEAHDEISPRDLPKDHPGREEAERQAAGAERRGEAGTTAGDEDPAEAAEAEKR
jgi:hypothetical protein